MKFIDNIAKTFGYMRKSDQIYNKIVRIPEKASSSIQTTPYAPTVDRLMDILEFYKTKMQNYSYADLSKNTPIVRTVHNKIVLHTAKEGFLIQSDYVKRCADCGKEYEFDIDVCDVCGGNRFTKPNDENRIILEDITKSCNVNDYPLKQELKSVTLDLLRYDEGVILKQYEYSNEDGIVSKSLKGVQRLVPINVFPNLSWIGVLGSSYTGQGIAQGFCPFHRDAVLSLDKLVCPECGTPLMTADYYVLYTEDKNMKSYYNRDEIIRIPMFEMSSRYSMVQTLASKITSLLAIDSLINDIYVLRKYPNRALFFKLNNIDALIESNMKNQVELKKDKNYIPMFATGAEADGEFMKVIDMLGSMDELKLIELQDKYEKDIVSALNCRIDPATREIAVDPDYIKEIQNTLNEYVLETIVTSLGIEDWSLTLRPSQKEDEANELRLQGLKIQNATGMTSLGFDILDYDEERGIFIYSPKPVRDPSTSFSSFSSNSSGLENTFGNLPGQEDLNLPKKD